jgi:hypothetical protein
MREISRESVYGGETREKRRGLGCKAIISKDQLTKDTDQEWIYLMAYVGHRLLLQNNMIQNHQKLRTCS